MPWSTCGSRVRPHFLRGAGELSAGNVLINWEVVCENSALIIGRDWIMCNFVRINQFV